MRAADGVTLEAQQDAVLPDVGPPYGLPSASANLYCDGRLDAAFAEVAVPVWRSVQAHGAGRAALWLMRYSRGGEHLKFRFHAPPELTASIASEFEKAAERFFERMPPRDPARPRRLDDRIPIIDAEDAVAEPHPDRTLLWTEYRCPPSHIGPVPLSSSPGFAQTYTAALAEATEIVLERIESADAQQLTQGERMSFFATFLLTLASLPGSSGSDALAHHRDWLLEGARADAPSALRLMDKKVSANPGQCDALRLRWSAAAQGESISGFQGFSRALEKHLALSLNALGVSEINDLDDDGTRQVFGAVARVLHKVPNLLEINISNEIYLCHLLHRAGSPSHSKGNTNNEPKDGLT